MVVAVSTLLAFCCCIVIVMVGKPTTQRLLDATIVSTWHIFALGGLADLLHPDANYDSRFCFESGPTNDLSVETECVLSSSNHVPPSVSK